MIDQELALSDKDAFTGRTMRHGRCTCNSYNEQRYATAHLRRHRIKGIAIVFAPVARTARFRERYS
jgi:hypothetical protein